jgi:hypothetical protein
MLGRMDDHLTDEERGIPRGRRTVEVSIPADFEARFTLWVRASRKLDFEGDPWLVVDIQQLGMTERLLLGFEREALELELRNPGRGDNSLMTTVAFAHSRLWLLGFYEVLRTYRQRVGRASPQFAPISAVFRHLELVRMPLAKHESKGVTNDIFYPLTLTRPDKGWVGWQVVDPKTKERLNVFRTELANEFPAAMETIA